MSLEDSRLPVSVYAAIAANLLVASTKFIVAFITGSSSMLSEGIHSVVDTGNELLLLVGLARSKKPADDDHPFGHSAELYFWSLIVAILLFAFGGGMSVYEGIGHLQQPRPMQTPYWNFVVLATAAVIESASLKFALSELRKRQPHKPLWRAIHDSKDPAIFVVIFEDTAALIGLLIAFIAILLTHWLQWPALDGLGSILIGVLLASVSILLAHECRGLLLGESADQETVAWILALIEADPAVMKSRPPMTMHFGPDDVLLNLDLEFSAELTATEIARVIERLKAKIIVEHPEIRHMYIEVQSIETAPQ